MRIFLTLIFGIFLLSPTAQAQDPIFSQFYAAPLQLNPAFAGNSYAPNFAFNYRNQWTNFGSAYVTFSGSYDQFVENLNSGFGIMVLADDAGQGLLKTNKISAVYSYRVQINQDYFLKLGTEASFVQARYDWDQFVFFDQLDPEFGAVTGGGTPLPTAENRPDNTSNSYVDISAGLLAYGPMFYGGISLKHLNTPNESLLGVNENISTGLPMRFTIHGGAQFNFATGNKGRNNAFLSPNIALIRQGNFGQINAGAYVGLGSIFAGAWYRHAWTNLDAAIFLIGFQKDFYKIGYSFDLTLSELANSAGGTHEVSLRINLERDRPTNYNDCFQLFR